MEGTFKTASQSTAHSKADLQKCTVDVSNRFFKT